MSHTELMTKIINQLKVIQFRDFSKGWFKGYIIVPSETSYYGKVLKRVNPRIKFREYDFVSKYPKLFYADTDGIIVQE